MEVVSLEFIFLCLSEVRITKWVWWCITFKIYEIFYNMLQKKYDQHHLKKLTLTSRRFRCLIYLISRSFFALKAHEHYKLVFMYLSLIYLFRRQMQTHTHRHLQWMSCKLIYGLKINLNIFVLIVQSRHDLLTIRVIKLSCEDMFQITL